MVVNTFFTEMEFPFSVIGFQLIPSVLAIQDLILPVLPVNCKGNCWLGTSPKQTAESPSTAPAIVGGETITLTLVLRFAQLLLAFAVMVPGLALGFTIMILPESVTIFQPVGMVQE